jgi:KUP system potassium uptake protein
MANPFFLMAPDWLQLPMVILATAATVIASQAVITGAYSLSRQAIQLGLLPRLEIRHTSESFFGQIYMPRVNTFLLVGVLLLVGLFRSSSALAGAYGIAVTGTMLVTAMMLFVVVWRVWKWNVFAAAALVVPFLFIDGAFLAANLLKIVEGGWFPLLLGVALMIVMLTWRRGRNRRTACPAPPYSSPATRPAHRPPFFTVSSISRSCTRTTSSSPSSAPTCRGWIRPIA